MDINFAEVYTLSLLCLLELLQPKPRKELAGRIRKTCGDDIELLKEEKELLDVCFECAIPVCRGCYEYERREGSQDLL